MCSPRLASCALLPLLAEHAVWCQTAPDNLSLEDLMNIQVTSVAKKDQKILRVAAAIFVITPEDIVRSGATNIPDLLRLVPGLNVGQINSNNWAISARGFNHELSDKLLVLIDGRSVYTLTFAGVNWDTQDVPLEDIARIEVIRGPGGTVWGANAVNGVINIITKKASETQGMLATAGGGTQERAFGTLQYGGEAGGKFSYRIFAKYLDRGQTPQLDLGDASSDGWHLWHGGFRLDGNLSAADSVSVQGDLYRGREGAEIDHLVLDPPGNEAVVRHADLTGGNILLRWQHTFANGSDATLQFYYDHSKRDGPESLEVRDTIDVDFQHRMSLSERQELIWGAGYNRTEDATQGTIDLAYLPAQLTAQTESAFVQDEIALKPDRLLLTLGTKLEHNRFTGFEVEPGVRLAWLLGDHHTLWTALSRASRTPSRIETGGIIGITAFPSDSGVTQQVILYGNPKQVAENVVAYEVGYRAQPAAHWSIDVATFFNHYDHLRSRQVGTPFAQTPGLEIIPIYSGNLMHGTTQGIEAAADWHVTRRWILNPAYTLLQMHLHPDGSNTTDTGASIEGGNPRHQLRLSSSLDLRRTLSWDISLEHVSALPAQTVPAYQRLDSQLRWRMGSHLELRVVGQNLLEDHHVESNDSFTIVNASLVKRGAFGRLIWHF